MPDIHSPLSPSSAFRWIKCTPSAKLNAALPDSTSEYALQGTAAHTLCEYKLQKLLGKDAKDPTENLTYFDAEMADCTDSYQQYVSEQIEKAKQFCKDPIVLVEQKLDFSKWVPQGFGTGDCVIVADNILTVIDFKYGVGVLVEAEQNPQMMCYALGALALFDSIYDIENVVMTIFQPRRDNISTYKLSKKELLQWADEILSPAAQLAAKGEGEFKAGKHCRFCKVKATCRKRAEYNLELARYDFEMPANLEDTEIEVILSKADELAAWCSDIKEYAFQQALNGKQWNGWKLVEGRSVRKYINEDAVAETVKNAGYDPYEHKVLGITAMTRMLGKAKFENLLSSFIEKPTGKPALVPKSDKRPSIDKAVQAADDFKEENES
ncbi:DUF2800 domain-containing protein [Ruminococcus callidus]|uniref:DUF2800 domain-containing protein n=1 Tax=Ruminococcus callidus TaxID=40519 RepID=UPI0026F36108|nr:DUF2800 domain-containing protein [Ruminococcus callidus]MBS4831730.1 DUF2800 domain-containing protein [Ruminococcus callidus]